MSTFTETITRAALPVIPLRNMVPFPGMDHNFELNDKGAFLALDMAMRADGMVFLAPLIDPNVEKPAAADLRRVGVIAHVDQCVRLAERSTRVVAKGLSRGVPVNVFALGSGALTAEVRRVEEEAPESAAEEAFRRQLLELIGEFVSFQPRKNEKFMAALEGVRPLGRLVDLAAANLLRESADKTEILEKEDVSARALALCDMLREEIEVARLEKRIAERVQRNMDRHQRDYYLREQMRVIQQELSGGEPRDGGEEEDEGEEEPLYEEDDLLKKIEERKLPAEVNAKLRAQALKLQKMPYGSSEAALISNYVETCLEIPWNVFSEHDTDLTKAREILDRDHDGLEKVKDRILEYLAASKLRGDVQGQILCLVGAPGVGKTSVASSIAEAMGRKYVRVSLGGVRDEADVRGHRKTYIGAMPGRIINALKEAGTMDPLITLDEIDKLTRDAHGDPASALLEVLDSEQNHAFRDHFVELPVDLSRCVFLATANETDTIPPALLDRMEVIRLNGYTETEKMQIARHHLIPKQAKRHGLNGRQFRISDSALVALIRNYTREQGVRNLERELSRLCRRAARDVVEGKKSLSVTVRNLEELLGKPKVLPEKKNLPDRVGVANGLAWTLAGGEMLAVEAIAMPGSGKVELTGSLGDVMKESCRIALSWVRTHGKEIGITDEEFYKKDDIHVHFPEGAIPKDGPSAGVTLVTTLASLLSGRPVRGDVAMTGEVTLHGDVLAIGGLREKASAALRAGMKVVLIPKDNVKDLDEVDPKAKETMTFIPCEKVEDVLAVALRKKA